MAKNFPLLIHEKIKKNGERILFRKKSGDKWESYSWEEVGKFISHCACGLISLGLKEGDKVSILSQNRLEWVLSDLSIISSGAITVGIYASNTPKEVSYIINHSESKFVFIEDEEQLKKIITKKDELNQVKNFIIFEQNNLDVKNKISNLITFSELCEMGKKHYEAYPTILNERLNNINPEDILTIIYTSGTTGPPKGAMLSHSNVMFICEAVNKVMNLSSDDSYLSFLPLAHALERIVLYMCLYYEGLISFARSINTIAEDIKEVQPTIVVGVPRVFEKIYNRIISEAESGSKLKKIIFKWCLGVGKTVSEHKINKTKIPIFTLLKYKIADELVFKKLRKGVGGKVKFFGSGGAPLAKEIIEFFHYANLLILEAYGLTETTAPSTISRLDDFKFGCVGKPLPGVQVKIAEDGEILIKGPNVFKGYFKNDEATREAFEGEWFKSGDIGEFDEDGFLKITDRKKDLIITAGGKNIAPQNIENFIKTSKFISQAVVIGDKRPFLTALLTLQKDEIINYAIEKGIVKKDDYIDEKTYEFIINHQAVKALVSSIIEEKNKELAKFETIKKFTILQNDFSQETGELTPTLKVKRKVVNQKYANIIERMYNN